MLRLRGREREVVFGWKLVKGIEIKIKVFAIIRARKVSSVTTKPHKTAATKPEPIGAAAKGPNVSAPLVVAGVRLTSEIGTGACSMLNLCPKSWG